MRAIQLGQPKCTARGIHDGLPAGEPLPKSKQMFGRMVKRYRLDDREFQRTINGTKQWMYGGIALRNENSNPLIGDRKANLDEKAPNTFDGLR